MAYKEDVWTPKVRTAPYSYLIEPSDGKYRAVGKDGEILVESVNAKTVIESAINAISKGFIFIKAGDYGDATVTLKAGVILIEEPGVTNLNHTLVSGSAVVHMTYDGVIHIDSMANPASLHIINTGGAAIAGYRETKGSCVFYGEDTDVNIADASGQYDTILWLERRHPAPNPGTETEGIHITDVTGYGADIRLVKLGGGGQGLRVDIPDLTTPRPNWAIVLNSDEDAPHADSRMISIQTRAQIPLEVYNKSLGKVICKLDAFGRLELDNTLLHKTALRKVQASPTLGTGGVLGSAVDLPPASGFNGIVPLQVLIIVDGTFAAGESVTVRITAIYSDGTSAYVDKSFTATGTYALAPADIDALIKDEVYITKLQAQAGSSAASTTVTVTVRVVGSQQ